MLLPEQIVKQLRKRADKITDDLPDVVVGFEAACELADLYTAAANLIEAQAIETAETQPKVLWTGPTEKRSGSMGRSAVETPPLPYPPGTLVVVVLAEGTP